MVPRVAAVLLLLCAAAGCSRTDDSAGDQSSVSSARDGYITEVVERLTAGPSEIDIEVEVVDSDRIHAVSYPPNKIAVTSALFDSLMTEAELACVLSHEISHHRLGHVEDRLAAGETPNVSSAVDALAAAGWTSGEEYAADAAAVELCHAAGYDPLALGHVFHRLKLFVAAQSPGDPGLVDHIDERIERLLDTIARQDLTGGANGFMSYYNLRSQAESDGQGEAQAPAGRQFLPEIPNAWEGDVVDVPVDYFEDAYGGMQNQTGDWVNVQCANGPPDMAIPTNQFDAVGHCISGCEAERMMPGLGRFGGPAYEHFREAEDWMRTNHPDAADAVEDYVYANVGIFGDDVKTHDSFDEDVHNQGVGVGMHDEEGSCFRLCSGAVDDDKLDFSAPQRRWLYCDDLESGERLYGDDRPCSNNCRPHETLELNAKCGDIAQNSIDFKNETDNDELVYAVETKADWIGIATGERGILRKGMSVKIPVVANCNCPCNGPKFQSDDIQIVDSGSQEVIHEVRAELACKQVPAQCGSTANDPHLRTFDGGRYDFQAAGEFVLVRSVDDDFEVQIRQKKIKQAASVNSAIAMKVGGTRIGYYAEINDGLRGLFIDGEEVDTSDGPVSRVLADGHSTLTTTNFGYQVRLTDGPGIAFTDQNIVNVVVELRGQSVSGLLGDANGDENDDLRLPAGEPFSRWDHDMLYGPFEEYWRVTPASTLFDYAPGYSTESYADPDFPEEYVTLETLTAEQRGPAEMICKNAGVPASRFDDCVFDVAVTGDAFYARDFGLSVDFGADLVFDNRPIVGSALSVHWRGPDSPDDVIAIARRDALPGDQLAWRYTSDGSPATLGLPEEPGDYELRYVEAQTAAVLVSAPLQVIPADAEVVAPDSVAAGAEFEVTWHGPGADHDQLAVVGIDSDSSKILSWRYVRDGPTVMLRAPDDAGSYEVRYIRSGSGTVLARALFDVTMTTAQLRMVDSVPAGSHFEVNWEGPDNEHDQLAVVAVEGESSNKLNWKYLGDGSTVTLRAPDEAGSYEVHYLNGQSGSVLVSEHFDVTAVTARLQTVDPVPAGSQFDVTWEGPDNVNDSIAVAPLDGAKGEKLNWQYTAAGNPALLTAPTEPGEYEVRYNNGGSGSTLTRIIIRVK